MNQVSLLKRQHRVEVIWVTSGAIASAVDRTGFKKRNRLLSEKQALSAIGQPLIMDLYNLALQASGRLGAQLLLTYGDFTDKVRLANFKQSIEKLLQWDVVPILNENDVVATDEIKFGDNDALSAQVAHYTGADRLVILTDVEGLYDSDPRKNPSSVLIKRLKKVTSKLLLETVPSAGTARGTGGMYSKLKAAKYASERSIETVLVKGDLPQVLLRIAEGESVGTVIEAGKV
jgi:glutamate 5-kinase